MTTQLKGALTLLLMAGSFLVYCLSTGEWRGVVIFGYVLVGQLSMWAVLWAAQRQDRVTTKRRLSGLLSSLAVLFPVVAKAIIPIAIGIGLAVGLLGWGGIAIWSKVLSIKMNELRKPIMIEQAMNSVTTPLFQVAAVAPPEPEPGFELAAADQPVTSPEDAYAKALRIMVPANAILEFSTNMIHWSEIHQSGPQDEITFWEAQGSHGFFRYKTFADAPDATR